MPLPVAKPARVGDEQQEDERCEAVSQQRRSRALVWWVCIAPEAKNARPTPWVSRSGFRAAISACGALTRPGGAPESDAIGCCTQGTMRSFRPSVRPALLSPAGAWFAEC